jgi:hypothetical protein
LLQDVINIHLNKKANFVVKKSDKLSTEVEEEMIVVIDWD